MTRFTAAERQTIAAAARVRRDARNRAKAERPKSPKAHRGRERDNAHLAFIRRLPCVATFVETGRLVYGSQAAHLRLNSALHAKTEGGQRKPSDRWVTPLSPEQHRIQGEVKGETRFWGDLGVDPFALCIDIYAVSGDEPAALKVIQSLTRKFDGSVGPSRSALRQTNPNKEA